MAARAPRLVPLFPFASEIDAVHSGIVELGYRCRPPARIGEHFGLIRWGFEFSSDAHAKHAFLVVVEHNLLAPGLQCGNAVDATEIRSAPEHKSRVLPQDDLLLARDPVAVDFQLSFIRSALCHSNGAMADVPHLWRVFRLDGFRVVPEIETVDIPVVEPQPDMVRMVESFPRPRLKRKTACDDRAPSSAQRIENWLSQLFWPHVGGKRLAINKDVDAPLPFIRNYANPVGRGILFGRD